MLVRYTALKVFSRLIVLVAFLKYLCRIGQKNRVIYPNSIICVYDISRVLERLCMYVCVCGEREKLSNCLLYSGFRVGIRSVAYNVVVVVE